MSTIDIQTIKTIVKEVHENPTGAGIRYSEFEQNYPNLFAAALEPTFDLSILDFMLMKLGNVSNVDTQNTASEEVGQMLFDKYVAPVVPGTDGAPEAVEITEEEPAPEEIVP